MKRMLVVGLVFVGVSLCALTGWILIQSDSGELHSESQIIRDKVNRLVLLPRDEEPAIATVTEKMRISDKFLEQAQDGDKLLLYYQSLKAYLYRPSAHKLVDIGPITVDPSAKEVAGTRIAVLDGGDQPAKATAQYTRLASIYKDALSVTTPQMAEHNTYAHSIVIDLTDDNKKYNLVNNIAATLGIHRSTLPYGEAAPANTDVLIIVGKE
jgi:hypothetical protein